MYDKEFYNRNEKFQRALSKKLTPWLCKNLFFKSVADFGCGCGYFLKSIVDLKNISDYVGINGNEPYNLKIDDKRFFCYDLSNGIDLFQEFDLVISLEVAEHIKKDFCDTYIFSLIKHSKKYILFSAATPGQGGIGHVNEQPHEYWHKQFLKYNFVCRDIVRPVIDKEKSIPFWYRQNIFLYERNI